MRVKINGKFKEYRTVWMENKIINLIDQPKLPHKFEIYRTKDYMETVMAIKNMVVRGAPAIGATAAYAMAQAVFGFSGNASGNISGDDVEKFRIQLSNILESFEILQKIDTTGVSPTSHPMALNNVMRDDLTLPCLSQDETLANAPGAEDGFFRVRAVLE